MSQHNQSLINSYLNQLKEFFCKEPQDGTSLDVSAEMSSNPLFYKLLHDSPSVVFVYNLQTMMYDFFSPNIERIFGYKVDQLQGLSGAEFAMSMILQEHLNILIQNSEVTNKYYMEYAALKRVTDTKGSLTAKIRKSDGNYVWALLQTMVLEVSEEGLPLRTFGFITDLTDIKTDRKVDFVFAVKSLIDPGYETLYSTHYDGTEQNILSRREIEILNCLSKGMRTFDIAEKLNISAHTVSTHRKNILKKTGKDNIVQLLN